MNIDLPSVYDPHAVEAAIYQKWLESKAFHAVPDGRENRFSMVIPPPNVTGALHLGHAINGTIQDVLVRYHRMKGDNTLWMPGIDHAGIATQAVVERTIFEKEKLSRHDLGREELVRRIWEWKEQYGSRILNQQAQLGASCDWDRTRFTLDETCAKAVREAFFKMFSDGLIFRGKRLVNWDTHLQTAVADDEIYYENVRGQMTSIKYPLEEALRDRGTEALRDEDYLIVATTRPETMLGDTAVAVHPEDARYTHLHGKFVVVPLVGRRIPIITDGLLVDPAFGTGVVKVTPAHDPNDYATGQRHGLEQINLLTPEGKMNENGAGEFLGKAYSYVGMKFGTAARKQILADLETLGLIAEKKVHEHQVGHSDRSKTAIEPFLSDQWFVKMGDVGEGLSEPRPSGSDRTDSPTQASHSTAKGYFLTFHTYATWLHGEQEGSVDPKRNQHGTPFIAPNPKLLELKRGNSKDEPLVLTDNQRRSIANTLREVCEHRGWTLHAVNVRTTHVHAVVSGDASPERMMNDFKSYATRRMREASLVSADANVWSRHGSTPYLWKQEDIASAIQYTVFEQGKNLDGAFFIDDGRWESLSPDNGQIIVRATRSLPNGRGSDGFASEGVVLADGRRVSGLAQAAMDAVSEGRVRITPERYAKGYLDWLGQKRDWCISRQLWWGHRIPVWSKTVKHAAGESTLDMVHQDLIWLYYHNGGWSSGARKETLADTWVFGLTTGRSYHFKYTYGKSEPIEDFDSEYLICVAMRFPRGTRPIDTPDWDPYSDLEKHGFIQDPDVLDTWFSSALWPLSTMGWPNALRTSEPRPLGSGTDDRAHTPLPDGRGSDNSPEAGLLDYFYPTSVLSTARDILTLWVARMVIFGLYCQGEVPFRDVYIHAVIQDGEGRTMSKSKGNGVDPVDIIKSHGADALRFTLASMATETQDIRMPVVKDAETGVNTSPKFDVGRNFANKIWNASRFILGKIDWEALRQLGTEALRGGALEDRWILSRLNATIVAVDAAIQGFHFSEMAEALRTFFWTDLCDWYLEIAKARIKAGDAVVQRILLECLETSLKLLHPVMPFVTEEIWGKLGSCPGMAIPGLSRAMLVTTAWPVAVPALIDVRAEAQVALVQSLTTAIREIQNRYPAAKGKDIVLAPRDAEMQATIEASRLMIEALTNARIAANSPGATKPANAAATILPDVQVFIGEVIDRAIEVPKLMKRKAELEKLTPPLRAKLGNEAAVAKIPPAIVQGWRDQLAKYEEEIGVLEKNLAELG